MAATTQFNPFEHGLFRRFLTDDGNLHTQAWNHAVGAGEHVGTCRTCGHPLLGTPTHQAGQITWYGAYCTNPQCGHEIAAPNAEYLRRSSRHGDMPTGYWQERLSQKGAG